MKLIGECNYGLVTQATNHSTGVELHAKSGVITLAAVALAAATNAEFGVTNSYCRDDSVVLLTMDDRNTTDNAQLVCSVVNTAARAFKISIHNPAATGATSATASKVNFQIINPI